MCAQPYQPLRLPLGDTLLKGSARLSLPGWPAPIGPGIGIDIDGSAACAAHGACAAIGQDNAVVVLETMGIHGG